MKNIIAVILGIFSFLCLFVSLNHIVIILDSIFNIWFIFIFFAYVIANYVVFISTASATALFQNKRWPLLLLYAFIASFILVYLVMDYKAYGFSLFPILVYGSVIIMSVLSFLKCISSGSSYSIDLQVLMHRSKADDWSADEFFFAKNSLDAVHKRETIIGLVIYAISIAFSALVFYLEGIFIYQ